MKTIPWLVTIVVAVQACSVAPRGSEEYWYNKMLAEQRAQCSLLPEPLSGTCLQDVQSKSYQKYLQEKQQDAATSTH